jgi:hypothetical protein
MASHLDKLPLELLYAVIDHFPYWSLNNFIGANDKLDSAIDLHIASKWNQLIRGDASVIYRKISNSIIAAWFETIDINPSFVVAFAQIILPELEKLFINAFSNETIFKKCMFHIHILSYDDAVYNKGSEEDIEKNMIMYTMDAIVSEDHFVTYFNPRLISPLRNLLNDIFKQCILFHNTSLYSDIAMWRIFCETIEPLLKPYVRFLISS